MAQHHELSPHGGAIEPGDHGEVDVVGDEQREQSQAGHPFNLEADGCQGVAFAGPVPSDSARSR